jgi:hypothetical protein
MARLVVRVVGYSFFLFFFGQVDASIVKSKTKDLPSFTLYQSDGFDSARWSDTPKSASRTKKKKRRRNSTQTPSLALVVRFRKGDDGV